MSTAGSERPQISERLEDLAARETVPVTVAWCALVAADTLVAVDVFMQQRGFRQRRVEAAEYGMWKRFVYPEMAQDLQNGQQES